MHHHRHALYERSATKWVGRLLVERPVGFDKAQSAITVVSALPHRLFELHDDLGRLGQQGN